MTAAETRIQAALLRERTKLQSLISREQIAVVREPDALDNALQLSERDRAAGELSTLARQIGEIDDALVRLECGEYGTCERCDGRISPRRLKAVPWASLCFHCATLTEQSGRVA